jgi:hypothetical protein
MSDVSLLADSVAKPPKCRAANFLALFENHRSGVLPPTAALEREIVQLGVSEKQKGRARQVFERAAEEAGFFEHGKNRLVMPGVAPGTPAKNKEKDKNVEGHHHHHGSGNGGGPQDTLIQALIEKLPPAGPWSADERMNWLKLLTMAFQIAYGQVEEIEIKKQV